jgi:L-amino acid N-acyltransferase YncA
MTRVFGARHDQATMAKFDAASLRLHQRAASGSWGTRERMARHHGRWRDTIVAERRGTVAGLD